MDNRSHSVRQVRLTVFENEPLALMAEQRLRHERIRCVVRSLGAGPGGWGAATNLPHALYVMADDEMRARQVLDLPPAEVAERERLAALPGYLPWRTWVLLLVVLAAVVLLGVYVVFTRVLTP
jgi:hypothetical protein